jgi:hypothetical protein
MENYEYILVEWPDCQEFMYYNWFDNETSLADCDKFGSSAYFIPKNRFLDHIAQNPKLPQDSYDRGFIDEP